MYCCRKLVELIAESHAAVAGPNAAWVLMQGYYKNELPGRVIFHSAKLTLIALNGKRGTPQVSFTEAPDP